MAYCRFLHGTSVKEILVPMGGNAEGILMEQGNFMNPEIEEQFNDQVISSAISLGKKYHFDAPIPYAGGPFVPEPL
jgi:exopolyphosphatase/guanosine-5'-triphosphate,3'-diphosphate pyrophosphatase